ncbi:plasma membrane H+-ATPase, partial [Borealophlyctis nickersoniae]
MFRSAKIKDAPDVEAMDADTYRKQQQQPTSASEQPPPSPSPQQQPHPASNDTQKPSDKGGSTTPTHPRPSPSEPELPKSPQQQPNQSAPGSSDAATNGSNNRTPDDTRAKDGSQPQQQQEKDGGDSSKGRNPDDEQKNDTEDPELNLDEDFQKKGNANPQSQLSHDTVHGDKDDDDDDDSSSEDETDKDDDQAADEKEKHHLFGKRKKKSPSKKTDEEKKKDARKEVVPKQMLETDPQKGLTDEEAKSRQRKFGENMLKEQKTNNWVKFAKYFVGPIQTLIEVAAILSAALQHWIDFGVICGLLLLNAVVGFLQEYQAGNTIDALKSTLALKARVIRNGQKVEIDAKDVVPGDVIVVEEGDIVPADAKVVGGDDINVKVDQSSITGESMAVSKRKGETIYSSSAVKRGEATAIVYGIGDHTFVGKAAELVGSTATMSRFQQTMNDIGYSLIGFTFVSVFIIFISSYYKGVGLVDIFQRCIALIVIGIPIALPTVITTTLAVGAQFLAKKRAIVSRLTAIEALASVNMLCTDKTGTLTKNKLSVHSPFVMRGATKPDLFLAAVLASSRGGSKKSMDPIDKAIVVSTKKYPLFRQELHRYHVDEFEPFDPVSKRIVAHVSHPEMGKMTVTKGAVQSVLDLAQSKGSKIDPKDVEEYHQAVEDFASRGYRSLGVAWQKDGQPWQILGVIPLFDPPRDDTRETINSARRLGLKIKMLTGDAVAIAKETARQLDLGRKIYDSRKLGLGDGIGEKAGLQGSKLYDIIEEADGFAQVFPEHKYNVVEALQQQGWIVAMT